MITLPLRVAAGSLCATAALAQSPPAPPPGAASTAPPHTALQYRSVLADYRAFAEVQRRPWKDSNEATRAAGGWRAYAREANAPDPMPAAPAAPPAGSAPATDSNAVAPPHPHHGGKP